MASSARLRSSFAAVADGADELLALRTFHTALADVNRLRIVRRLARGSASIRDLIEHVGLSQPLVSWHVRRLRAAGVISTRRAGRETLCTLNAESFSEAADRERRLFGLEPGGSAR